MIRYCAECGEEITKKTKWVMALGFIFCCHECMRSYVKKHSHKHRDIRSY